jgi:predicted peroxiredoxin
MTAAADPTRCLVLVLWACGPDRPGGATLAAAPFVYALAARAFDIEVQMHFTSSTVRWLVPGVAAAAHTDKAGTRTVQDYLDEAHRAGVQFFACGMARAEHCRPVRPPSSAPPGTTARARWCSERRRPSPGEPCRTCRLAIDASPSRHSLMHALHSAAALAMQTGRWRL